ncbi:hypothetical protein [Haloferax larsenii]|uniref:hypothetical protein n=1 Tax=Haloferax larsenii TaxID=302484 RepID=UPI0009F20B10|nr:hypothetical protein [Haloferax larsenii]
MRLLEDLLRTNLSGLGTLKPVFGTCLSNHVEAIEAARKELQTMTAGRVSRLETFTEFTPSLPETARRDTTDLISGLSALEQHLEEHTDVAVSETHLFEEAAQALGSEGEDVWSESYPSIERVHLAGVSMIGASLLDFLASLSATTQTEIHLYLREGTGPQIADRIGDRLRSVDIDVDLTCHTVERSKRTVNVPVTEFRASTRREEARIAMAVVRGLLDDGVPPSDVVVVARDVDTYERPLTQAAREYGHELSVWTQLPLTRTLPYRLIISVCRLLDAEAVDVATLCDPVMLGWVAPGGDGPPVRTTEVGAARRALQGEPPKPLSEWESVLDESDFGALKHLVAWVLDQPETPSPVDVRETLSPVVDAYREVGLAAVKARDSPTLRHTVQTARAVTRVETLVSEVAVKYREWDDQDYTAKSWKSVIDLLENVATVRPGRREHAHGKAIDVLDATDTWIRRVPHVVALGLVDGEWPQPPEGMFPKPFRDAVVDGDTRTARSLGVQESWTANRERDHFADAVNTATEHLVCSWFQRDFEGGTYERSPFLDDLDAHVVSDEATRDLLGEACRLPDSLRDSHGGAGDV